MDPWLPSGVGVGKVLTTRGGAGRHYLRELDALPDRSLIAMVPVSLKLDEAGVASAERGNAVGEVMVKLGTQFERAGSAQDASRRTTTSLRRLLTHLDHELTALEVAAGVG